jgi:hypothetical protein
MFYGEPLQLKITATLSIVSVLYEYFGVAVLFRLWLNTHGFRRYFAIAQYAPQSFVPSK